MKLNYIVGKTTRDIENYLLSKKVIREIIIFSKGKNIVYDLNKFSPHSIDTIFDVGANTGQSVKFFKRYFRKSIIHSFEPISSTFTLLQQNVGKKKQVFLHNYALGNEKGSFDIFLEENSEINSLLNRVPEQVYCENKKIKQNIYVEKLDDVIVNIGLQSIDLLKIDVEGFELQVLQGAQETLSKGKVQFVLVGVGLIKTDALKTYWSKVDEELTYYGFHLCGFYDMFRWGYNKSIAGFCNALYINNRFSK